MLSPNHVQVLATVLQRAPASLAEQMICAAVVDELLAQVLPPEQSAPPPELGQQPTAGADVLLRELLRQPAGA